MSSSQPPENIPDYNERREAVRKDYLDRLPDILAAGKVPQKFWSAEMRCVPVQIQALLTPGSGYFITGPVGTGKTYLAIAMLKNYLRDIKIEMYGDATNYHLVPRHKGFMFASEVEIFGELRRRYSCHQDENGYLEQLCASPFLVIDDFGTEANKEWIASRMFRILDKRYGAELPTIISSNLSVQQVAANMDDRIASRILEMGPIIDLAKFPDRRLKVAEKYQPKEHL